MFNNCAIEDVSRCCFQWLACKLNEALPFARVNVVFLFTYQNPLRVEGSTPFLCTSNPRRRELRFPHRAVFVSMKTRCRTRRESCRCNVGGVQFASMEEGHASWLCKREKLLSVSSETFPKNRFVPWRARQEGNLISCYEFLIIQLPIIEWVGPECVIRQRMEPCDNT